MENADVFPSSRRTKKLQEFEGRGDGALLGSACPACRLREFVEPLYDFVPVRYSTRAHVVDGTASVIKIVYSSFTNVFDRLYLLFFLGNMVLLVSPRPSSGDTAVSTFAAPGTQRRKEG